MCLYPKLIKNRKYVANKKNGGVIPAVTDERTLYVPVGCQNCMECRKQKARSWQVRLLEDIKQNRNGKFITLTFSDKSIKDLKEGRDLNGELVSEPIDLEGFELDNEIATRGVRFFLERWRKKYKKSLRHWFVTELGHSGTENIHIHGIVWTDESLTTVESFWQYGFVWKGKEEVVKENGRCSVKTTNYVNERTVNYIIKYVTKVDHHYKTYKSRILTSPGIGRNYTINGDYKNNKYKGKQTVETYRTRTGHKINMPVYWRNKIYSEQEREQLWLQKLDKEERFVLGQKVSVKNGDKHYMSMLERAREINRRIGYGDDSEKWNFSEYERDRRILMQKTRIKKAQERERDLLAAGQLSKGFGLNVSVH